MLSRKDVFKRSDTHFLRETFLFFLRTGLSIFLFAMVGKLHRAVLLTPLRFEDGRSHLFTLTYVLASSETYEDAYAVCHRVLGKGRHYDKELAGDMLDPGAGYAMVVACTEREGVRTAEVVVGYSRRRDRKAVKSESTWRRKSAQGVFSNISYSGSSRKRSAAVLLTAWIEMIREQRVLGVRGTTTTVLQLVQAALRDAAVQMQVHRESQRKPDDILRRAGKQTMSSMAETVSGERSKVGAHGEPVVPDLKLFGNRTGPRGDSSVVPVVRESRTQRRLPDGRESRAVGCVRTEESLAGDNGEEEHGWNEAADAACSFKDEYSARRAQGWKSARPWEL